jgi:hypothetical protein
MVQLQIDDFQGVATWAPASLHRFQPAFLRSVQDTCTTSGRVAFGSNAWDLFDEASREYDESL